MVDAELGGHKVSDDGFEVLTLDVLTQRFLGDLPGQADVGAAVLDGAGVDACTVAVVVVLGLLTQDTGSDADLVDLASLGGAHFVANQVAQGSGLEGLLMSSIERAMWFSSFCSYRMPCR